VADIAYGSAPNRAWLVTDKKAMLEFSALTSPAGLTAPSRGLTISFTEEMGWINIVTPAPLLYFPRARGMGVGVLYWIE
jgi:hypothetical protein